MTRWLALLLVFSLLVQHETGAQSGQQPPLGQWRVHLSYVSLVDMAQQGKSIAAIGRSGGFVFSADTKEYQYLNPQTGLSQTGLAFVKWDEAHQQWVLAYSNGSLDLVKGKKVETFSDFNRFANTGNKTIFSLDVNKGKAYLSTGLGLAVLDLSSPQKWALYSIAPTPLSQPVHAHLRNNQYHYVATPIGLFRAKTTADLGQAPNWENVSSPLGLPNGPITNLSLWKNQMVAQIGQQIWAFNDSTQGQSILTDTSWSIVSLNQSEEKLLVTQNKSNSSRVLVFDPSGTISQTIPAHPLYPALQKAVVLDQSIWLADRETGLWQVGSALQNFSPNGSLGEVLGQVVNTQNGLAFASGQSANGGPRNRNG
ncbi:MAG: hypothetical protein EAZ62_05700, partial [Sphingobacteriia bacterium]